MSFITQGKTNLKPHRRIFDSLRSRYILIVVAVVIGAIILALFLINSGNLPGKETGNPSIKKATLPVGMTGHSCVESSANHKIYCFGGSYSKGWLPHPISYSLDQIIEYDSTTNHLSIKNSKLPPGKDGDSGRSGLSCAENSATHKIYCFGGIDTHPFNQIIEYSPLEDAISIKEATLGPEGLGEGRYGLSCAENSSTNKIYCFGGYDFGAEQSRQIIEYDPATDNVLIKQAILHDEIYGLSCAENSSTNKIYCFGGFDGSNLDQIIEYDSATDTLLTKKANLPVGRKRFSCAENSATHKIYCFGGIGRFNHVAKNIAEIVEYNPATDTLSVKSEKLPSGRTGLSCAENSATNQIYCFGGSDGGRQIIEYTPPK